MLQCSQGCSYIGGAGVVTPTLAKYLSANQANITLNPQVEKKPELCIRVVLQSYVAMQKSSLTLILLIRNQSACVM